MTGQPWQEWNAPAEGVDVRQGMLRTIETHPGMSYLPVSQALSGLFGGGPWTVAIARGYHIRIMADYHCYTEAGVPLNWQGDPLEGTLL